MTPIRLALAVAALFAATALDATAEDKTPDGHEALSEWRWLLEFSAPVEKARYFDLILPPSVLDHSASRGGPGAYPGPGPSKDGRFKEAPVAKMGPHAGIDWSEGQLNDLRLFDKQGKPVPYALRVRRPIKVQKDLPITSITPSSDDKGTLTIRIDLQKEVRHNGIQIVTSGSDFRRKVRIEAGDDGVAWQNLINPTELLSFHVDNQALVVNQFTYPESSRRYLRVIVSPDPGLTDDKPKLETARVFQTVEVPGETEKLPAAVGLRHELPGGGRASTWSIAFAGGPGPGGGERRGLTLPVAQVRVEASDKDFARQYRLEVAEGNGVFQPVQQGEWKREPGGPAKPLEITFGPGSDVWAKELRLVVIDASNPPLDVTGIRCSAAARELIFPAGDWAEPLRLYVGNPAAPNPAWDFAANLPDKLDPKPVRVEVDSEMLKENSAYVPPPVPFTERYPWLVYVVLGTASVVLLGIMLLLARQALARTPQPASP